MTNVLLSDTVTDQDEVAVSGALVYIYDGTGLATLYDSMAQVVSNPVTTDEDGYWEAWVVTDRYYTEKIWWSGRLRYVIANVVAGDPPVGPNSDPNLRFDLASDDPGKGASLVAHKVNATGAVARTGEDKFLEMLSPYDFGVIGTATSANWANAPDDTAAWQAWINYCVANNKPLVCHEWILSKITNTLSITTGLTQAIPFNGIAVGLTIDLSRVTFTYNGTRDRVVLDIGDGTNYLDYARIRLPTVQAYGLPTWAKTITQMLDSPGSNKDTGVRVRNPRFSEIHEELVYGFSAGIEYENAAWNRIYRRHAYDCQLGWVWSTRGNSSLFFANENNVYGGRAGMTSLTNALGDAYGDVLTWDQSASYRGHNSNRFWGPCYELGTVASGTYRVPVLMYKCGGYNYWHRARHESTKGPFAICNGGRDTGTTGASLNVFDVSYNSAAGSTQNEYVLQVNGAYGNIYTGPGAAEHRWRSPDMVTLLSSAGGADSPYLLGPMFLMDQSVGSPVRTTGIAGRVATGRNAIHLNAAAAFVAIDTTYIKTFRTSPFFRSDAEGGLVVAAFDSSGSRLSGNATDATWGNEPYVKGSIAMAATAIYGNCYATSGAGSANDFWFTVREEVKKIYVGYTGGLQGFSVVGYSTPETPSDQTSSMGMRVFVDLDDAGDARLASAKPDTAGTHGYYSKGLVVASTGTLTTGNPPGWICTTAGWLAAAWVALTAYASTGRIVTNDSGKMYELTTAGTSGNTGGPTGTGSSISDGTCVWKYIGVKAVFSALANMP